MSLNMEEIVGKIRAVLISDKGKSNLKEMQKDYKMLMGEDIPYRKLGYSCLENFINNVPSLKLTHGSNGMIFVEAVTTSSSKHMVQLINKQKTAKKNSSGFGRLPKRYPNPKTNSIPRLQNQEKSRKQTSPQWRTQHLDRAHPNPHVPQVVCNDTNSTAQQRLIRSVELSQSSPTAINQNSDTPSRKLPLKISKSLTLNTPQLGENIEPTPNPIKVNSPVNSSVNSPVNSSVNSSVNSPVNSSVNSPVNSSVNSPVSSPVVSKSDSRPRMRSHNSYSRLPIQSLPQIYSGPRLAAPTLTEATIKAILDKNDFPRQSSLPSLMCAKEIPSVNKKRKSVPDAAVNNTVNTESCINIDNLEPFARLQEFTRIHGLSDPVRKIYTPNAGRPFICSIKIDSENFTNYPLECKTPNEAETEAVNNAFATLLKRYSVDEKSLLISTENDVLTRIPPIIESNFSGLWAEQIASDYRDKYGEQLPPNWLALLDTLPTISVEPTFNRRYVLKMCKYDEENSNPSAFTESSQLCDVSVPSNKLHLVPEGWLVEVTYIASTIEVWCRRVDTADSDSYCDTSKKLQNYYNSVSGHERATNVAPGGFYVVTYEGCWSRVRVLNISERYVTCFFIDYGDENIIPKSDIYVLKREFAREQAQAFVCQLSGLEELANMSAAASRLEQLSGKTYLAKLHTVEETPVDLGSSVISITLFDIKLDEDVAVYSDDINDNVNLRLLYEITGDSVPKLNPQNINHVYITHITNKGDIYVQCHSEAFNKLNELIAALNNIDFNVKFPGINIPLLGSPEATPENDNKTIYLARWTQEGGDGNLYRAKVIDRSPCGTYICLYYIDYGNSQIISSNDISHVYQLDKISEVLLAFPPLATKIVLDIDQHLTGFSKKLVELLPFDTPVLLKVVRTTRDSDGVLVPVCELFRRSELHNELYSVNASLKYIDTSMKTEDSNNNDKTSELVKKLERLKSISELADNKPVPSTGILTTPYLPKPSEFFDVRIPFAVNPWNFFIQPYSMCNQLRDLMKQLQQRYSDAQIGQLHLDDVIPGRIYASKYHDGQWYRTSVIKVINSGSVSVFYCDFGYYANLTVKQLIPLDSEFLELPYQAIKARLAGIQPRDTKWSMEDCKYFEKLVIEKTFVSVVCSVQQDELYQCDSVLILRLIDTSTEKDVHVDRLLVKEGIAAPGKN